MKRRLNYRFTAAMLLIAAAGALSIAREHRPSFLRPGLRLYAYVANAGDGTVTAIDLVQLAPVATIAVGAQPGGLRAHPTRPEIWGVSSESGEVWVIEAGSEQVAARIRAGAHPQAVEFSPDGMTAYVAASRAGTLAAIDCAARRERLRAATGRGAWMARATPDGRHVVVSNREESTLSILDARSLATLAKVEVASHPERVEVTRDGAKAFVAGADAVSVVDLTKKTLLANLPLGGRAGDLILKPDGGEMFAPSAETNGLAIFNVPQNEYAEHMVVGTSPARAAVTQAGTEVTLYISDAANSRVVALDARYRVSLCFVPVGQRPGAMALTPNQDLLLVVDEGSNDVAVIRTRDIRRGENLRKPVPPLTLIPVGNSPRDVAIKLF
jgi:YVTN family beta-propeller protein